MASGERAIAAAGLPHHVRRAAVPDALAGIGEAVVTLAIWQRPPPVRIARLGGLAGVRVAGTLDELPALLGGAIGAPRAAWHEALIDDVAALAARYAAITGSTRLSVRLDRLTGDGCSRFHADYVGVRLITTYTGRGTQWLAQGDPDAADPFELATGDVALFKGRLLAGDDAIVHRSPPIAGSGEERLLLVIDTAAEPLEAGA